MSRSVSTELRQEVRADFGERCAYCQSPEALVAVTFEIEHILPIAAGGRTIPDNLCLACPMCNRFKGSRVAALDPGTGVEERLFHPRRDRWSDHFAWDVPGLRVIGLTPSGRATAAALQVNRGVVVRLRQYWVELKLHPPETDGSLAVE